MISWITEFVMRSSGVDETKAPAIDHCVCSRLSEDRARESHPRGALERIVVMIPNRPKRLLNRSCEIESDVDLMDSRSQIGDDRADRSRPFRSDHIWEDVGMSVLFALIVTATTASAQLPATSKIDWRPFKSSLGNFRVVLPDFPDESIRTIDSIDGEVDEFVYSCTLGWKRYFVRYYDRPSTAPSRAPGSVLDSVYKRMLDDLQGNVVKQTDVVVSGHPAREYTIEAPTTLPSIRIVVHGRILVVDRRVYQVQTSAYKSRWKGEDGTDVVYFTSFKLINPPPPPEIVAPKPSDSTIDDDDGSRGLAVASAPKRPGAIRPSVAGVAQAAPRSPTIPRRSVPRELAANTRAIELDRPRAAKSTRTAPPPKDAAFKKLATEGPLKGWKAFRSAEIGFRVYFPESPERSEKKFPFAGKPTIFAKYSVESLAAPTCFVVHAALDDETSKTSKKEIIDKFIDEFIKPPAKQVVDENATDRVVAGSREVVYVTKDPESGEAIARSRMLVAVTSTDLFAIGISTPADGFREEIARAYLDSFELIERSPKLAARSSESKRKPADSPAAASSRIEAKAKAIRPEPPAVSVKRAESDRPDNEPKPAAAANHPANEPKPADNANLPEKAANHPAVEKVTDKPIPEGFRLFTSQDPPFHVLFPGEPKTTVKEEPIAPGGEGAKPAAKISRVYKASVGSIEYRVYVNEYPYDINTDNPDEYFDQAKKATTNTNSVVLLGEKPVSFGKIPGREFRLEVKIPGAKTTLKIKQRMYLTKRRDYRVMVSAPDDADAFEKNDFFLDSFAID